MVPVLFQNTLKHPTEKPSVNLDQIFGVEPLKTISPVTEMEMALALRVLEGCCLINRQCRDFAQNHDGIKVENDAPINYQLFITYLLIRPLMFIILSSTIIGPLVSCLNDLDNGQPS